MSKQDKFKINNGGRLSNIKDNDEYYDENELAEMFGYTGNVEKNVD